MPLSTSAKKIKAEIPHYPNIDTESTDEVFEMKSLKFRNKETFTQN